jgi:hypothetical protein
MRLLANSERDRFNTTMPEYISMILRNIMGWWKKDAASMEQN